MKVATFIFFSFKHGMIEMVIIMKKILIVEDDESIADSLKEMLENKAYIVEVSYSKKETLEKERKVNLDKVIYVKRLKKNMRCLLFF